MDKKSALRTGAFEKRQKLVDFEGGSKYQKLSKKLAENIERECAKRNILRVFSFFPSKGEPDFSSIFFQNSRRWFFPKVDKTSMIFHECKSLADLQPGAFGIMEPKTNSPEASSETPGKSDLILVPGLLFDLQGQRLGYGKGFYDRFFERNTLGIKIGIAFDDFIVDRLPHEKFDIPVAAIITESKTIKLQS